MSKANNIKYKSVQPFPGKDFADGLNSITTQIQNATHENCSEIPPGLSNLIAYLQRDEAFERRSIGHPAPPGWVAVAQDLDKWEKQWSAMIAK
jgi:hypothetical protein